MAWGTTFVITINSIAYTLNRINNDNFGSDWECYASDRSLTMRIRHTKDAASKIDGQVPRRHFVEVTETVYATATTKQKVRKFGYTIVHPTEDDPAVALLTAGGCVAAIGTTTHNTDLIAGLN